MRQLSSKITASLTKIFNDCSNVDSLIENTIKVLIDSFNLADAGIIYLFNKGNRQLVPKISHGYPWTNNNYSLAINEGLPGKCLIARKPLFLTSMDAVLEDTKTLKPRSLDFYNRMRQGLPPICASIAIPLLLRDKIIGAILLEHYNIQKEKFTKVDSTDLEILGDHISLMIEHYQLNLELKESKRSYRELLGKFLASSEDERKRISREIHDDINHILLSIKLNLEDMEITLPPKMVETREKLKILYSHVSKAFDDLHRLSLDLRPPGLDESGLPQTLEWYTQILSKEAGLPITIKIKGLKQRRTAPVVETELLRIAQEALSNILKHAQATSIKVMLSFGKSNLMLEVEDDGIGFDAEEPPDTYGTSKNLGLLGMKERAERCGGELKIHSSPGCGTKIKTIIPIGSYDWGIY